MLETDRLYLLKPDIEHLDALFQHIRIMNQQNTLLKVYTRTKILLKDL